MRIATQEYTVDMELCTTSELHETKRITAVMTNKVSLHYFDTKKTTILIAYASECGIGAVLSEQYEHGTRRKSAAASRYSTDTERRYAVIEKEALGSVWGLECLIIYHMCPILVKPTTMRLIEYKYIEKYLYEYNDQNTINEIFCGHDAHIWIRQSHRCDFIKIPWE